MLSLTAFCGLMMFLPLLPSGYSSYAPNQGICLGTITESTTVTGSAQVVSTSSTTGFQASTQTITVGTSTHVATSVATCMNEDSDATMFITTLLNPLVVILVTVPVAIIEYPFGLPVLTLFMLAAYGLTKRKLTANKPQA